MRVSFHSRARDEVERAQEWYEERSFVAASGFLQELSRALHHIRESPYRYPAAIHGTRRLVLERFPFNVFYRIAGEEIVIVAVAHQKRRPNYWQDR
jgi:toxin ParE1/3/4